MMLVGRLGHPYTLYVLPVSLLVCRLTLLLFYPLREITDPPRQSGSYPNLMLGRPSPLENDWPEHLRPQFASARPFKPPYSSLRMLL